MAKISGSFATKRCLVFYIATFFVLTSVSCTAPAEQAESLQVRLTVMYPTTGSLKTLIELRKQGLLDVENLQVLCLYHEQEMLNVENPQAISAYSRASMSNYQTAMSMVEKEGIDWIHFRKLTGDLNRDNLFKDNPLADELKEIFQASDGVLFFGGADIPPYIYGEKTNLLSRITTTVRSLLETSVAFHLLGGFQDPEFRALLEEKPEFPVLGLCLGSQTINVGAGGTLIQDIPSDVHGANYLEDVIELGRENWHNNPWAALHPEAKLVPINMHPIKMKEEGMFVRDWGFSSEDTPYILSAHHQMAGKLGKGLKVIATSMDGKVVEAIQHESYPNVLGVQFHPESSSLWDPERTYRITPDDEKETSGNEILLRTSKSMEFHQKIWTWFSEALENAQRKYRK